MADNQSPISDLIGVAYTNAMMGSVYERMDELGKELVYEMQANLVADPGIDTGALYNSIRHEVTQDGDKVVLRIYADAENPNGEPYAEFIEYGTGVENRNGNGRTEPWRYVDVHGQWHTTTGHRAHPFIEPALDVVLPDFKDLAIDIIKDISKYHGRNK